MMILIQEMYPPMNSRRPRKVWLPSGIHRHGARLGTAGVRDGLRGRRSELIETKTNTKRRYVGCIRINLNMIISDFMRTSLKNL